MKKIRCPKCDETILFNPVHLEQAGSYFFTCHHCGKEFYVRCEEFSLSGEEVEDYGSIVILENVFGYKQELPLKLGQNIIGCRCKGTLNDVAITTGDPSVSRNHCIIDVKEANEELTYTLRDFPSLTGTFLHGRLLQKRERVLLEDDAVITIGAASLILRKRAN